MKRSLVSIFVIVLLTATLCTAKQAKPAKNAKSATKAEDKTTLDAWISDEKCGAKIDPDCSKKCQEQGAKLVVVNIKDKSIIPVANQDSVKGLEGQHVTVVGTMKDGALTIASVKPVKKG